MPFEELVSALSKLQIFSDNKHVRERKKNDILSLVSDCFAIIRKIAPEKSPEEYLLQTKLSLVFPSAARLIISGLGACIVDEKKLSNQIYRILAMRMLRPAITTLLTSLQLSILP